MIERTRRGTEACARAGGPLLDHASTANVARDLDLLRQAVGDERLTFLGFSYGTQLGQVYANLFPDRVRALTLDAVLDPVEWTGEPGSAGAALPFSVRLGSAFGADRALDAFFAACAADARCVFREPRAFGGALRFKYDRLLDALRRRPLTSRDPQTGEELQTTYQDVVDLTLGLLYSAPLSPLLALVLEEVEVAVEARRAGGPARALPRRARELLQAPPRPTLQAPPQDEPYAGFEGFALVACADTLNPANPWVWPRAGRAADRATTSPSGLAWAFASLPCATWPGRDADRYAGPWNRATAGPVLLVGNRQGDPATPYDDARRVAARLPGARLLTLDSWGHTAQGGLSRCIDTAIDRYLIDLVLPAPGTVCRPDRAPFDLGEPAAQGELERRGERRRAPARG